MMVRARFMPAKDENGKPIASLIMRKFNWQMMGEADVIRRTPDRTFVVKRLPSNMSEANLSVVIRAQSDGKIDICELAGSSGFPNLDKIACPTLIADVAIEVARDKTGAGTATVRSVDLAFVVQPVAPATPRP